MAIKASLVTIILGNGKRKAKPDPNVLTCIRCWSAIPQAEWDAHERWCNERPFPAYLYHLIHL